MSRRAALVTLGCARNDVDSEELAARLTAGGWDLVEDAEDADAVLVNTCGFVAAAKKDSVDVLLAHAAPDRTVVAVGCLAERYGNQLAEALPEATVLGFDAYPDIAATLDRVLAGDAPAPHQPTDRRQLLPITPVHRDARSLSVPGHASTIPDLPAGVAPASGPPVLRRRLTRGPVAPLKIASGCDRRCSFCAIPSFRGAFVSRPAADVLAEARWLAADGVRELVLVSENSTSYGKDFGELTALEALLPRLAVVPGLVRVRPVYLQPAEVRPGLIDVLTGTAGVAAYADLSFQHASGRVLRRMRRFGDAERFLDLLAQFRARAPQIGARSNVIVGFPGETEHDVEVLEQFLTEARLDVVGVFGYSDEDGTEAESLPAKVDPLEVEDRVRRLTDLVEHLTAQRAQERVGELVEVLVDQPVESDEPGVVEGRAAHQAPEIDGSTMLSGDTGDLLPGDLVLARVVASSGVDLEAEYLSTVSAAKRDPVTAGHR